MITRNFEKKELSAQELSFLQEKAKLARAEILKMTSLAGCGHPGGSMSSIEMYTLLWHCTNVDPKNPLKKDRDRIVVSHGHTSPGVYAALGNAGFFDMNEATAQFRKIDSIFAGHVEQCVPGVEWDTGNLGQGLSAAVAFALASRVNNLNYNVFCLMGDGEQQKGQQAEARRTAVKYNLKNLIAFVDLNNLQINGKINDVMPQNIAENWTADGWLVLEVDGHDFQDLYKTTKSALNSEKPVVILAKTIMGKGVSFMENDHQWHGSVLKMEQLTEALKELNVENNIEQLKQLRAQPPKMKMSDFHGNTSNIKINAGTPKTYTTSTDNRSAWGTVIADIAKENSQNKENTPVAVLDCDLMPSVKTADFFKATPELFFQIGIQEHNAATIAGAMTVCGIQTFFADFGVFGVDETYNQHRLSVLNHAHPKIVCTHCGLDVGEDGKTHQCVDYIGVFRNLIGAELIVPADPNQTDRAVRYMAATKKLSVLIMGRSKLPIILKEDGTPFFGSDYKFEYGKADVIRTTNSDSVAIIATGTVTCNAMAAYELLKAKNINAKIINIATPLLIDELVLKEAALTGAIVTVEDHLENSGLGSIVAEKLFNLNLKCKFKKLGVTHYGSSGTPEKLFAEYFMDADGIAKTAEALVREAR